MKTYILRDPKTVEPQRSPRWRPAQPVPPLHAPVPPPGLALFLGLDVHNDSIAVSLAPSDSTRDAALRDHRRAHDDVLKLLKQLQAAHPGAALKFCYEAGPRGYPIRSSCLD